ncbi:hypothetical protein D917_10408 [Trichinella nativa]|uniref:Uncharacterized protein n=1 Tax=Trichinella nativa TaxID=6335 RepID=A0A1Y3EBT9_9BILA|nr:hypothetical protein D917_10408 [Trichinella nativa]
MTLLQLRYLCIPHIMVVNIKKPIGLTTNIATTSIVDDMIIVAMIIANYMDVVSNLWITAVQHSCVCICLVVVCARGVQRRLSSERICCEYGKCIDSVFGENWMASALAAIQHCPNTIGADILMPHTGADLRLNQRNA